MSGRLTGQWRLAVLICAAVATGAVGCRDEDSRGTNGESSGSPPRTVDGVSTDAVASPRAPAPVAGNASTASTSSNGGPPSRSPVETTSPATATTSSQPADVPAFRPLADAAVGEWVEYAALNAITLRYEIAKVRATSVTTRVIVHNHGKPLGLPATREDARDPDLLAIQAARTQASRAAAPTTIEAAGRRFDATLYEDRWTDEEIHYIRRTWVSTDVPVFGTIRMELHGDGELEARLELRAFGRGGDESRSPASRG